MPFVEAGGVQVNFPFEPYPCQMAYMEKVVQCLREGYNGILESPTGTGKTLCLLCASLAWMEDKKAQITSHRWKQAQPDEDAGPLDQFKEQLANKLDQAAGSWSGEMAPPKIIYASRTHSQLSQAVQEMKRTAYSHFKVCVLGSREQLCIHPQVMKEESNTAKVHLCRAKVTARSCHFYNSVENAKVHFTSQVLDIEDLVKLGEKHNCCPYYTARELKADADIIFLPYNYLLDPKSRRAHGVELQGNIVIFDEAHNLERICEESASFDFSSAEIASAVRELADLSVKLQDLHSQDAAGFDYSVSQSEGAGQDFTLEEILRLKAQLLHLEEAIDAVPLPRPNEGVTKPGSFIFELLSQVNLSFGSKGQALDLLDKLIAYLTSETSSSVFNSKGAGLSKFADVIKIVFSREPDEYANLDSHKGTVSKHYKIHIREAEKRNQNKKADGWGSAASGTSKTGRVLSYWCFSPGHTMQDLKAHGVRSIILTSGTLSPMGSFKAEMGIGFQVELENPHVIEKEQVWIGTVSKGPDGVSLSSAYDTRFKPEYQASLGNAIVNFARVVPNGLLLFFPSYPVMDKCLENWSSSNIWGRIEQYKPIYVEPRGKNEFHTAMENFYDTVQDSTRNGAVFAAVTRGKVSEGLDFSDNNGRAVVITGLPYPPRMDPRVSLKMQFLDEMRGKGSNGLTGQEWYNQQASRAVNQAIGRVIRHKQDFGAIILCDHRFASPRARSQLPAWLRPSVNVYSAFGLAIRDMMNFFKTAEKTLPVPGPPKKKAKLGSLGCQGAYFQPTLSRMMTPSLPPMEKASVVSTHVASLHSKPVRAVEDPVSLGRLRLQYEMVGQPSTSSAAAAAGAGTKGLLGALRTNESQKEQKLEQRGSIESQVSSYQTFLQQSQDAQAKQKKKILLKKSSGSEVTKNTLQTAEQYIGEVKRTLSKESYTFFSKSLADYKRDGDLTVLVACMADIFTDNPGKYHLFREFYRFVRPQHKRQFDQTCQDLLGEVCGYKPEHSVPKKRPSEGGEHSQEKKRKLETGRQKCGDAPSDSAQASSLANAKLLDTHTHLNHGRATSGKADETKSHLDGTSLLNEGRGPLPSGAAAAPRGFRTQNSNVGKTQEPKKTSLEDILSQSTPMDGDAPSFTAEVSSKKPIRRKDDKLPTKGKSSCSSGTSKKPSSEKPGKNCDHLSSVASECGTDGRGSGSGHGKSTTGCGGGAASCLAETDQAGDIGADALDKENLRGERDPTTGILISGPGSTQECSRTLHTLLSKPNSGYTCGQCGEDATMPLKAPCEHVCCMDCWKGCIRELKACPQCGRRVKRKHLSRLFFPSGPNNP